MRRVRAILISALCLVPCEARLQQATGKIVKVLPHYLDLEGRHAVSPSMFDRDAYQAELRRNPERIGGMRYDVHWKARRARGAELELRIELITPHHPKAEPLVIETKVTARRRWGRWSRLSLNRDELRAAGDIMAWRVSLWEGERMLAEQRSFLW